MSRDRWVRYHPRTCEVCTSSYTPTYSKQRTCGLACAVILKGHTPGGKPRQKLSQRDLNAPISRERTWWESDKRRRASQHMLNRYHSDPANWTTARKRRRLFERDGWLCRSCGKVVTDNVHRNHPRRAVAGHIVAKATGGQWTDENMATLCHPCNVADGVNRTPIQMAAF